MNHYLYESVWIRYEICINLTPCETCETWATEPFCCLSHLSLPGTQYIGVVTGIVLAERVLAASPCRSCLQTSEWRGRDGREHAICTLEFWSPTCLCQILCPFYSLIIFISLISLDIFGYFWTASQEKLVPLRALANLAWAASVQGTWPFEGRGTEGTTEVLPFFYRSLQHELTRRSQLFEGFERFERADSSVSALGFSSNALEILWASTFVDLALPTKQLSPIWHALMRCSKAMCTTPSTALPQIAPMTPSVPISALCRELTCEPRVVLQLSDRILVPKADSLSSSFFGSLARGETFPLVHSNWVEPWATFKPTEDFWSLNHRVGRPLQICAILAVCCKL